MLKNKLSLTLFSLLTATSFAVNAETPTQHIVVAPQCLTKHLSTEYRTLAATKPLTLIQVNAAGIEQLITAKSHQATPCGGFMDVTQAWNEFNRHKTYSANHANTFLATYIKTAKPALAPKPHEYAIQYETQVNQLLTQMNPQDMWTDLTKLTSFSDRYASSDNGVKAAKWIEKQVETMAKDNNRSDVTITEVATGWWYSQPSVVVKVGDSSEPGIVIGGHMDTLSSTFSKKPGADDDGSGSVTVLETARLILASGMTFKKPIYFIWYAAEEEGLVGSGYVVDDFQKKKIPVDAVLQLDMTGYEDKNDPTMWLVTDNVDKNLNLYIKNLINTYVKQKVDYTACGYACSDHASWDSKGFAAVAPFETAFGKDNPDIHSSNDTMEKLSLSHMTDFAKLAVAFAVELAEPAA